MVYRVKSNTGIRHQSALSILDSVKGHLIQVISYYGFSIYEMKRKFVICY